MLRSGRNSLEKNTNAKVHVVVVRSDPKKDSLNCIGVYNNMKDAMKFVIVNALKLVDDSHYDPFKRYEEFKEDVYSLSKFVERGYKDMDGGIWYTKVLYSNLAGQR